MKMKNKTLTIFLIILLSIIVISVITVMILLMNNTINFKMFKTYKGVSEKLEIEEIYDNNMNEININVEAGNIYVKNSGEEQIKVLIYNEEKNSNINNSNGILDINVKAKKCKFFCINTLISKVEIYLPKNYSNKINIENNFGNIEIEEFTNANIKIEENFGDIKVLDANNIKVKNDLGNVNITKANTANIEVSAGDIKIKEVNEITAENNLGDIEIKNIDSYLNISNDCGDIELDNVVLTKDSKIKSDLGDIEIDNIENVYIDVETDLGKEKINNNYRDADVTLEIKNDLGDIKVDN
ncbi:MAG: DUF4097 domain-containing protein [Lactobacillales bacterium]|nr:DUF4097 domain-containing protein [Lactobacillales bacterium]